MKFSCSTIIFLLSVAGHFAVHSQSESIPRQNRSGIDDLQVQKISPSSIISDIRQKKKTNLQISGKELAVFANQILAAKGFNFSFDISELFNQKSPPKEYPPGKRELIINFPFEFSLIDNRKKTFTLTAKKNLRNGCYDESFPAFPLLQATKGTVTVMVKGNPIKLKMPDEFHQLSVFLLGSKTTQKIIQNWILPYNYGLSESNFVGISGDGAKLYLKVEDAYLPELEKNRQITELALEISPDGKIRFVSMSEVKKKYKWETLNSPTEVNDYLVRVTINAKSFILAVPDTSC